MLILGIETSCDETSAAVVEDGRRVISNVVSSQEKIHSKYFGVVPELASREHLLNINGVLEKAVEPVAKHGISSDGHCEAEPKQSHRPLCHCEAEPKQSSSTGMKFAKLDISSALSRAMKRISAIAWTSGPGLAGSLIVGQTVALTLSYVTGKPLVPVNHLEGHIFSVVLDNPEISPPFLSLIVSGGHTDLVFVERFGRYRTLGRTRDDAAGEAFDKVARILGLKYPGGPQVQKFAAGVDPGKIRFPRPFMEETDDFSFSGLKTAVVYYVRDLLDGKIGGKARRRAQRRHLSMCEIKDICAGFQEAVVETLLYKTMRAAKRLGVHRVAVCGGVSANSRLRDLFKKRTSPGTKVFFPSPVNCTDNAAMIASAGYFLRMSAGRAKTKEFGIDPGLEIKNWY